MSDVEMGSLLSESDMDVDSRKYSKQTYLSNMKEEYLYHPWNLFLRVHTEGTQANIWQALEEKMLVEVCTGRYFRLMLDCGLGIIVEVIIATIFICLVVFPDEEICDKYGDRLARTIYALCAMLLLGSAFEMAGARMLMHSKGLPVCLFQARSLQMNAISNSNIFACWPVLRDLTYTCFWIAGISSVIRFWEASVLARVGAIGAGICQIWIVKGSSYARSLASQGSYDVILRLKGDIDTFPLDRPHPSQSFWKEMIDEYKLVDQTLEQLWQAAIPAYGSFFVTRLLLCMGGIVISIEAKKQKDWLSEVVSISVILWSVVHSVNHLRQLSDITDACNCRSSSHPSIFAAAFSKFGTSQMTERQENEHALFVRCVEISPCGVQMFTLVDKALVIRVGAPLLTGIASFVSYAVANLSRDN